MPITYHYLPQHSAIVVTASGDLDREDFLGYLAGIVGDRSVPSEHVTLLDARNVTNLRLTPEDIDAIAAFTRSHSSRAIARQLAIVTRGEKETTLAAKYEELARRFKEQTIVFFDVGVACRWLGIPEEAFFRTGRD